MGRIDVAAAKDRKKDTEKVKKSVDIRESFWYSNRAPARGAKKE